MALTLEWKRRIELWQKALWDSCYRPLGSVSLSGFATREQLSVERARVGTFVPMPTGTAWGAKWEYGWFRTQITVPPEAAGQRLVLRLETGGQESLVWINGMAAGSLGWGHREVTLTTGAAPGLRFEILAESYAGHGHITVGDGPYPYGVESVPEPGPAQTRVGESSIGIWREEIYQAAIDFTTLFELSEQLDPLSLRAAEIHETLMRVTLIIDPELPEEEMLTTIHEGRAGMRSLLAQKNGPTMPTLHAFGHAHLDVAWLWPLEHTERKMAMTTVNQLQLFEEYPHFRFLQSQPHLYWMLREKYPQIYQRLKEAVENGRIIADGGMWIEADTNLTGGESLIRQLMYGRRFFKQEFGVDSRVVWLPDVFGYSGSMPQILLGCGMAGFATQKITWAYNGGEAFPYNTFWWEGIDGSRIPAHIFTDYNSELRPAAIMTRWNSRLQRNGIRSLMLAFGWGDGGGGPTRDHLEFFARVQDLEGLPRVRMSSPAEFFADLETQGLPKEQYTGELYFQAHRGTYTSQARTKRGNRKSEIALREAEFWGSLAHILNGFDFGPPTLVEPWRKLLLNQFHDILPGSSIHRVYEEAEESFEEIIDAAESLARAAARSMTAASGTQSVFNSLSWARTVLLETTTGPIEVTVPACGWAAVETSREPPETGESYAGVKSTPGGFELENELILARFDLRGELTSLWDKDVDRELMAGAGNRLSLFRDVPTRWDAWDIDSMAELSPVETEDPVHITVLRSGPLAASLRMERALHKSRVVQVISLRRGSRRIDFETTIDWQENHKLLKVGFPVDIHANEAISEIQFGHLRRPNHRSRQYDLDRFEVCNHKWTALAEEGRGAAVLNDCKYGLSVHGNTINLTLLKSAMAPDMTADRGIQKFVYALYTWNGSFLDSKVVQEAYDLNIPPLFIEGTCMPPAHSLFNVDAGNILIETVKMAEDGSGDLVVRLYESMRTSTRCMLTTSLRLRAAASTNLLEEEIERLEIADGTVHMDFRPFEIKTVRLQIAG